MKLLLDEMWPPSVAQQLRARNHDVKGVVELVELRGSPDEVIFAFAQEEDRAVVTEDASGFVPLAANALRSGGTHCGLILTTARSFPRHDPLTYGRLVSALQMLLSENDSLDGRDVWLRAL